ncbi:hypothetical protein [Curtobacterium sp. CFBP9011]|uniref:hypothetical protein n=1 Tax=Curtobacterium sp. CFBP9011 TaxID=3096530 RepID=UPI002A6AB282|nr:hypothetical protein [Curtobacterium sp. CFBP9011]MDY1003659.1 hypothetical protein [Curtobacterium sp. CFBP9011]
MYVVGKIVVESVSMDARLRALLAVMRGDIEPDAALEAAPAWNKSITDCRELLPSIADDTTRTAIAAVLDEADHAWNERNRYVHDMLVDKIAADDESYPTVVGSKGEDQRLRRRLARDKKRGAPAAEVVSLDHAVELVEQLVAATWRLQAARGYLLGRISMWRPLLFGHVTGVWDGSVESISADDDEDA